MAVAVEGRDQPGHVRAGHAGRRRVEKRPGHRLLPPGQGRVELLAQGLTSLPAGHAEAGEGADHQDDGDGQNGPEAEGHG